MTPALPTASLHWMLCNVQAGLLLLDAALRIVWANPWLLQRARLSENAALKRPLTEVFPLLAGSALEARLRFALRTGLPSVLAEALHDQALPLYAPSHPMGAGEPVLRQSLQIIPMASAGAADLPRPYVLLHVNDVTPAVARERLLRQQAQRMHAMAHVDALTDIGNRRHFDVMFAREWRQSLRAREALGLVLFDVDHFKPYNDRYGHQQGDQCLRVVANLIESLGNRPRDVVCRYGGEEIAMLLPDTPLEHVRQLAQKAVDSLRALALPHEGNPGGVVTISAGLACEWPQPGMGADTLLLMADRALYQAKRNGRDQVAELRFSAPAPDTHC